MAWLFALLTSRSTMATPYTRPRPPILRLMAEVTVAILVAFILVFSAFYLAERAS